jgi:hypothetical protein
MVALSAHCVVICSFHVKGTIMCGGPVDPLFPLRVFSDVRNATDLDIQFQAPSTSASYKLQWGGCSKKQA